MNEIMEWYMVVIRKYAQFSGRARRREYWTFTLVNLAIYIVGAILAGLLGRLGIIVSGLVTVFSLAVLIPGLAVSFRRMHDIGRSAWWLLIALVPIVGGIVLLVFCAQDSQPGDNQYGPNPKGAFA